MDAELDDATQVKYAREQLLSTDNRRPKSLESHRVEADRLRATTKMLNRLKALGPFSALVLQSACANAFLDLRSDRRRLV